MRNRLLAVCTTASLIGLGVMIGAPMAMADSPVVPPAPVAAVSTPAPTPAPATSPTPTPAVTPAPAPTPAATQTAVSTPPPAPAPAVTPSVPVPAPTPPKAPTVTANSVNTTPSVSNLHGNTSKYETVVWSLAAGSTAADPFKGGAQTFVSETPENTVTLNVTVPTTCGTSYQVDAYANDGITAQLVAGKTLIGPNNPRESFPYGQYVSSDSKLVVNTACAPVIPKDATATVTITTAATCSAEGVATDTVSNATLVGTLAESAGAQTATFTADTGHEFADGTTTMTVNYTVPAQLTGDQCTPPPQACTAGAENYSDYYTEDTAPTEVVGGLEFIGDGSGSAVDTYHAESVPLAGINGLSYTVTSATGYDAAYVMEVDTAGTSGYTTLSAEPYMNGEAGDATGTFNVDGWAWWSSHIASGPGSQGQPITLAAFEAMYPDAVVISHGIHLGSTEAAAGDQTTVSDTTFLCGETTFGLVKPAEPSTTPTVTHKTVTDCTTKVDTTTTTTTTPVYTYDASSNTWVAGTPTVVVTTSTAPATATECPAAVVTPPSTTPTAPASTPPAPVALSSNLLAHTGLDVHFMWAIYGGMALLAGLVLVGVAWYRRHRGQAS